MAHGESRAPCCWSRLPVRNFSPLHAYGHALIGLRGAARLKAIALWFPKQRMAMANGYMVTHGALRAATPTAPGELLLASIDWSGLVELLAGATGTSAVVTYLAVPEAMAAAPASKGSASADLKSVHGIARSGNWRHSPRHVLERSGRCRDYGRPLAHRRERGPSERHTAPLGDSGRQPPSLRQQTRFKERDQRASPVGRLIERRADAYLVVFEVVQVTAVEVFRLVSLRAPSPRDDFRSAAAVGELDLVSFRSPFKVVPVSDGTAFSIQRAWVGFRRSPVFLRYSTTTPSGLLRTRNPRPF
jgi:hypothetical protein